MWLFKLYTVCPGSSDPTLNIASNYFIKSKSCDLKPSQNISRKSKFKSQFKALPEIVKSQKLNVKSTF